MENQNLENKQMSEQEKFFKRKNDENRVKGYGCLLFVIIIIFYIATRNSMNQVFYPSYSPSKISTVNTINTKILPIVATPEVMPSGPRFGDGSYIVGTDIQPGTYRTREASRGCYYARLGGFSGSLDEILANANTNAPAVITISKSDKGFESARCGTWTQDLSAITTDKTTFEDGIFIVGTDIKAGMYKSTGANGCYYSRLKGFSGTISDIIFNKNTDSSAVVTIGSKDKGFSSERCGTWTKVK